MVTREEIPLTLLLSTRLEYVGPSGRFTVSSDRQSLLNAIWSGLPDAQHIHQRQDNKGPPTIIVWIPRYEGIQGNKVLMSSRNQLQSSPSPHHDTSRENRHSTRHRRPSTQLALKGHGI